MTITADHITPPMGDARAQAIAQAFDLRALPPDFFTNPYPVYRALREQDPVRRMPDGSVFLTRWADLAAVYRDAASFSSDKHVEFAPKYGLGTPLFEHHTTSLVFNDPPLHTRVRRLIMGALTRRAIADMEAGLIELVDRLLDGIAVHEGGDLIEDFASAIPVEIIGNLLGVPHAERGPLRDWSLAILGALEPTITPAHAERGHRAVTEMCDYLRILVAARRQAPGDPERDVLTRLIQGEADGEQLSEVELLQNCIFLLNAGHETTTNLIGNALVALQEHPAVRERLLQRLGGEDEVAVLDRAVDEFLRYESSNQLGNRRAVKDVSIGGVDLPAGTLVTLCIGAANRDPAQFADPEALDIAREPNKHLAFGFGIHQCAGLSLARLEGRIAIGRFLHRFPNYRLTAAPTRGGRARFRGFLAAPFAAG
ncbi:MULTISPECIES: cytochrome P450 [unclassified Hydrogenophaga]|uniref:cytochrome P450 n=1 Tax=unclassified Hydrogenophaga TaxID=2610897 RepID=UPI00087821CA|nr:MULTISPECIES: cytochrome P450 [unclassified Hydrogenophaga]MBN9372938.1 cytochrome P450 [Hydrogenophaga sp.]OJV73454.1 MAG: cytochrome [Hydrogenophaga sp. 70-12]